MPDGSGDEKDYKARGGGGKGRPNVSGLHWRFLNVYSSWAIAWCQRKSIGTEITFGPTRGRKGTGKKATEKDGKGGP